MKPFDRVLEKYTPVEAFSEEVSVRLKVGEIMGISMMLVSAIERLDDDARAQIFVVPVYKGLQEKMDGVLDRIAAKRK